MSRKAPIISMEEFKSKIMPLLENENFPEKMPKEISKDLSKISFDWENFAYEGKGFADYPCGFKTLKNGLPVIFLNAGGDWQYPVCMCLYWDGKNIRGYIPTKGNVFNVEEKCAYENEEDSEREVGLKCNPKEIEEDIVETIKIV